ncbi:MAG: ABC transporter ATP-binding protein [Ruminococcus sp.]|nr:ABC transporter ATP-binding protein [Ruminococcus sp.]
MTDYENAIEINGLTKKYDGFTLDNVTFSVPKGSIMGFIGQNGAGKTTTIKAILNIIDRDGGTVKMLGMDSVENEIEIKENIAVVFDELPMHDVFNIKNVNKIMRDIYRNWDEKVYFGYVERFGLPLKKKIGQFSKGMKMKLQIAVALSHNARLLVMDEATTGLDPVVRSEILDIFLEYLQDENNSILMSSHITSDLEKIADSVTFIDNGKILLTGYKDDILSSHGLLKCTAEQYENAEKSDFVSVRVSDFGVSAMCSDMKNMKRKYPDFIADRTTLEEIMLYYVNRDRGEWF